MFSKLFSPKSSRISREFCCQGLHSSQFITQFNAIDIFFFGALSEWPLLIGAVLLAAFNDNAAITYLASLVPGFSPSLKYAAMAGAVSGGGLTVIANALNPAGQSLLAPAFGKDGIAPAGLFAAALLPTIIMMVLFMVLP